MPKATKTTKAIKLPQKSKKTPEKPNRADSYHEPTLGCSAEEFFNDNITDDLPEEMRAEVKLPNQQVVAQSALIISLFELKPQLTVDQIMIGLYRKYGISKCRSKVSSLVSNMRQRGLLSRDNGSPFFTLKK